MKTFWHVLKKDLRRLAIPFGLWALLLGFNSFLSLNLPTDNSAVSHPTPLLATETFSGIVLYWILTVILSAWIVLEDPPKGTASFWLTRPFARRGVAAEKLFCLSIIVALPLLVQVVIWHSSGAGWHSLLLASLSRFLNTAFVPFAVAALAVTAESFGQFAINGILILIGAGLVAATTTAVMQTHRVTGTGQASFSSATLSASVAAFDLLLTLVIGLGIVWWRYLRRHARFVVAVVSIGALIPLVTPLYWRWDFLRDWRESRWHVLFQPISESGLHFTMDAAEAPSSDTTPEWAYSAVEITKDASGNVVVPYQLSRIALTWPGGESTSLGAGMNRPATAPGQYEPSALAKALAPSIILNLSHPGVTHFMIHSLTPAIRERLARERATVHGQVAGLMQRYEIAGELPLTAGAKRSWGSRDVEIDSSSTSELGTTLLLREGFASSLFATALNPEGPVHAGELTVTATTGGRVTRTSTTSYPALVSEPIYVLVNRVRHEALLPDHLTKADRRDYGGYTVETSSLDFPGQSIDQAWLAQAVLVCVRSVEVGTAKGTVEADGARSLLGRP
jgi:hypothetical protein